MADAKDVKSNTIDVKSIFSEVDKLFVWDILLTDYALVSKRSDPIVWIDNTLRDMANDYPTSYDVIAKLVNDFNNVVDNCILTSINTMIKPKERQTILDIFQTQIDMTAETTRKLSAGSISDILHKMKEIIEKNGEIIDKIIPKLIPTDESMRVNRQHGQRDYDRLFFSNIRDLDQKDLVVIQSSMLPQYIKDALITISTTIKTLNEEFFETFFNSHYTSSVSKGQQIQGFTIRSVDFDNTYHVGIEELNKLIETFNGTITTPRLTWETISSYSPLLPAYKYVVIELNKLHKHLGTQVSASTEECIKKKFLEMLPNQTRDVLISKLQESIKTHLTKPLSSK